MHLWSVGNLEAFLTGRWTLEREITDRRANISGRLQGIATFTPVDGGLMYRERGELQFGAHQGPAEQQHCYVFGDQGRRALIRFADGRPFHELDLSRGADRFEHLCEPDLYEGTYVALGPNHYRSRWAVRGPRKDYDLVSVYTRRPDGSSVGVGGGVRRQ